jgi:hypothetical protein
MGLCKCTYHDNPLVAPCGEYADYEFSSGGQVVAKLCQRHATRVVEYKLGGCMASGRMGELEWRKVSTRVKVGV